jgi:hypothetical protein
MVTIKTRREKVEDAVVEALEEGDVVVEAMGEAHQSGR